MVFLVGSHHVGHLRLAGSAPGSPEVYEHPFALAHILAQFVHVAVGISLFQIGELLANKGILLLVLCFHLSPQLNLLLHEWMTGPDGLCGDDAVELLLTEHLLILADKGGRDHGLVLLFEDLTELIAHLHHCYHHRANYLCLLLLALCLRQILILLLHVGDRRIGGDVIGYQTLIDGRAFQRAVVGVDGDGRAIVEEECCPVAAVFAYCHQGVFIGHAAERELPIGHHRGDNLSGLAVHQLDLCAVVLTDTVDGILYLLCLCGQRCCDEGS